MRKIWTKKEIDYLKNNIKYGTQKCAYDLNRSLHSVYKKAKKLDIYDKKVLFTYDKEELKKIVDESTSYAEVLRKYNKVASNTSYKTLKKYIKLYHICVNHFNNENSKKNLKNGKISNTEMFIENSVTTRMYIKKRIIDESLIDYKCQKCDNNGDWLGEKLSLHLDHINGVNNDNRLENLRFLCPNCHSQTSTYGGKRNKLKRQNKYTQREIVLLHKDRSEKQRKTERPPYEELKHEVKKHGYSATGRKYGVSDNAIRKWIKFYEKYEKINGALV